MKYACIILLLALCACEPKVHVKTDTDAIVEAVLADPDLAKFIHPEAFGRLPVTVALNPPSASELHATAFGRPVRLSSSINRETLVLDISVGSGTAKVKFKYPVEGLGGELALQRINGQWLVKEKELWEN